MDYQKLSEDRHFVRYHPRGGKPPFKWKRENTVMLAYALVFAFVGGVIIYGCAAYAISSALAEFPNVILRAILSGH